MTCGTNDATVYVGDQQPGPVRADLSRWVGCETGNRYESFQQVLRIHEHLWLLAPNSVHLLLIAMPGAPSIFLLLVIVASSCSYVGLVVASTQGLPFGAVSSTGTRRPWSSMTLTCTRCVAAGICGVTSGWRTWRSRWGCIELVGRGGWDR